MHKICVWMNIPSHWQTAFFNALFARDDVDLQVRYFGRATSKRIAEGWPSEYELRPYEKYVGDKMKPEDLMGTLDDGCERTHIISYNFKPQLVRYFCRHSIRWCHWGEMPGYRLEELLRNRAPLYRVLQPTMLRLKKREGRLISTKAMGALAQGVLAERAFKGMGIGREKIAELFYCPDPLPFKNPNRKIVEFARGRKVFLSVSAICRRKGIDLLIKSFSRLKTDDWCLVLCGYDYTKGKYLRFVQKLNLQDRILFLGAQPVEQIAEVYSAADVFVLASRFDGWGVVLNEAASMGLPLISTDYCGAAHHQIKSGGNGFRVKAGSVRELSVAMKAYVDDSDLIGQHGAFSRELYFKDFSPERNGERLIDAVERWSHGGIETTHETRIIIQQPALPQYRVPFFRALTNYPDMKVKLLYSTVDPSLANKPTVDLDAEFVPMKIKQLGPVNLMWHSVQLSGARRDACDVLVLSWNVQYLSLVPALLRARFNGVKTILWGHGYSKNETPIRKIIRDWVGRLADALLFYDYTTAEKFISDGWDADKIHVAPNSLNQSVVQEVRADWLENKERLHRFQVEHQLDGKINLIFIGRIYAENRLDLLIKALPAIQKVHPEVQLLIIGRVNEVADGLIRLAEELDVGGLIRWLGAIYDENEIAPLMLSSKLFCYPANIGLSIMHAMGYGVPVVTGDHIPSHNPEIHVLQDGYNGLMFKHLNVQDLATRLCSALGDPETLSIMSGAARDTILQSYTVPEMTGGFFKAVAAAKGDRKVRLANCVERNDASATLVSVVMPTYKRLDLLKRAVESVLCQTHENWELIVSDNELPGGASWEYLQELGRTYSNVRVYQNTSGPGLAANLNNALKHARGEWIKPLFDDDELMPNCLQSFLAVVSGFPAVVLAGCLAYRVRKNRAERCDLRATRADVEIVEQKYTHLAMYLQDVECGGVPSQMFLRRSAIDAGALMPSPDSIAGALDSCWYGEILKHGDRLHLAHPLVREYQGTHDTLTSALDEDIPEEELILYRRHIYNYIATELNPPSLRIIEQMVYGIRGMHKLFIGGDFRSGVRGLLKVRNPKAMILVFKWILRRSFPGWFNPTPRLRYSFSECSVNRSALGKVPKESDRLIEGSGGKV